MKRKATKNTGISRFYHKSRSCKVVMYELLGPTKKSHERSNTALAQLKAMRTQKNIKF